MTQGYVIPFPVFDECSTDTCSCPFYVSRGWVAELIAFNFATYKIRCHPQRPLVRQAACLNRIIYCNFEPPEIDLQPCGVLPDITKYKPEILCETPLSTHGCEWSLSACHNYRLLDLPGAYRLILNDVTAVGIVSVYMLAHPASAMPARSSRLYFGE
jgi:hypothetical protein